LLPYLGILFISCVFARWSRTCQTQPTSAIACTLLFLTLTLFAGLRNHTVGTDTDSYVYLFQSGPTSGYNEAFEFGFVYIYRIVSTISGEYWLALTTVSAIVVFISLVSLRRHSTTFELSLFIFITTGIYSFQFNGARQAIAMSIFMLSFKYIWQRRPVSFLLVVLIASAFHISALVTLPAYFLASRTFSTKRVVLLGIAAIVAAGGLDTALPYLESLAPRLASYTGESEGGGYVFVLSLLVTWSLFVAFKRYVALYQQEYFFFLNLYSIAVIVAILATISGANPSGPLRFTYYFSVCQVFIWPIIFINIPPRSARSGMLSLFFMIQILFFWLSTSTFSDMVPYRLNSQLF
jgi:hypothetical protein